MREQNNKSNNKNKKTGQFTDYSLNKQVYMSSVEL